METLERIIGEHPLFAGLEPHYTGLLVGCASNVRFAAGTYIFKEGDEANEFYLIRSGRVALEIFAPQRKPIIVETLSVGDVLGWSWLLPPYHWKFHAHTTRDTRAIALDGKCLRTKCEQNRDLGYEVLKRFAQIVERRLEATRVQLLDVYSVPQSRRQPEPELIC
jgi:CRP/FNR family transcriptional regulator, cyclic AMP receptor protein